MNHADVFWDGESLSSEGQGAGRRLGIDPRCLKGEPVRDAWAHVCALPDDDARIQFDQPEVQQVRRDALQWWISMLGDSLVCLSTFTLDAVHYAGAVTVTREQRDFAPDPFARLFPGTVVPVDFLCAVASPAGPVLERYSGAPWPGGRFA